MSAAWDHGPPADFVIRRADPGELAACAGMMAAAEPWVTLRRSPEASLEILTAASKEVYLAAAGAEPLGFLVLDLTGPFPGYLQTVCVARPAQGQGVGTRLVAFAEARIFRDSPNVFLCVSSFNEGARRLYERLGYETVGVLRGFLVAEHDEILLRKSIGSWQEFRSGTASAQPPSRFPGAQGA